MPTTSHTEGDPSKTGPTAGRFQLCVRGEVDLALTSLDGIGPKSAATLAERGIANALDLLALFPNRYQRTTMHPDAAALRAEPEHVVLRGVITSVRKPRRGTRQPLEVVVTCDGVRLVLVWFHIPGENFARRFDLDAWLEVAGAVDYSRGLPRLVHPTTKFVGGPIEAPVETCWEPVYPAVEGVPPKRLRSAIEQAFAAVGPHLVDIVPARVAQSLDLGTIREAIAALHALEDQDSWEAAWARARPHRLRGALHAAACARPAAGRAAREGVRAVLRGARALTRDRAQAAVQAHG